MKTLLSWLITPYHLLQFIGILVGFHFPLIIARTLFGQRGFGYVQSLQNLAHLINIRMAGTKITIERPDHLPEDAPLILVANHQSMYDIPLIIWSLRKKTPRFIAKIELNRFIPTISYSLRHGGHLIIDRSDPKSAIQKIEAFGQTMQETNGAVCIFPEGTRAKDGQLKPFKVGGLQALIRTMPSAYIVPIAIDGSWKIVKNKLWPIPFGERLSMKIFPAIKIADNESEKLINETEQKIRQEVQRMSQNS